MTFQCLSLFESIENDKNNDLLAYERRAWSHGFNRIAGVDEAGRGPMAGPVVAAACILPKKIKIKGINDSKQLTEKERETLFTKITSDPNIAYGIGIVDHLRIDEINILQATLQAMKEAIEGLTIPPDLILVDGISAPQISVPYRKIIQGDGLSCSIAAASIIAKVTRDRMMVKFHEEWPDYGFDKHKGYCTQLHFQMLKMHGPSPIHRRSFQPVKES